jgi:hypothetical protein
MLRLTIILFVALLWAGFQEPNELAAKREGTSSTNEVREIIRPKCGSCHTSTSPSANPRACSVFDLAQDKWQARMNVEQLGKFQNRLTSLPDSLKMKIDKFVKREIAFCALSGS